MPLSSHIDYANTVFKYPTLTWIRGEPTSDDIRRLKNELRANAASVECNLGGGNHGYLGLVESDADYIEITGASFVTPIFPETLNIPAGTDMVAALNLQAAHKQEKADYRECKNIERTLLRQVQTAIEERYIDNLINEHSRLIEEDISDVLIYLTENYGYTPMFTVKQKETEVLATVFDPADSLITVFKPVEDLRKLALQAEIPYSEQQILGIAMTIIRNTRDFESAQENWDKKLGDQKTWVNFKTHFKAAQKTLKRIRGPTMSQSSFHHANMLAEQVRQEIGAQTNDVANIVHSILQPYPLRWDLIIWDQMRMIVVRWIYILFQGDRVYAPH